MSFIRFKEGYFDQFLLELVMPGHALIILEIGLFIVIRLIIQNAKLQVGDLVEDSVFSQLL